MASVKKVKVDGKKFNNNSGQFVLPHPRNQHKIIVIKIFASNL